MNTQSLAPSTRYTHQSGEDYVAKRQSDPSWLGYKLNFDIFKPYLNSDDDILDFGCGNGGMLPHLRSFVNHVDGLEVNLTAAEIACETGCNIYHSFEEVPSGREYSAIVSNHVLEHVRDVPSTLERIRKLLRPRGRFIVKLPMDDWRDSRQRMWDQADIDHHLQTWTPRLFANLLYETGFEVEIVRVLCSAWHPRLFPFVRLGLGSVVFRAFAMLMRRRQLLAVAKNPADANHR